jgi:hypothetical protein
VARRFFSGVTEGFFNASQAPAGLQEPLHRFAVPLPTSGEETKRQLFHLSVVGWIGLTNVRFSARLLAHSRFSC